VKRNSSYAETEAAETVKSYDPFKASGPQNLLTPQDAAYANITVYRGRASAQDSKATPQKFGFPTTNSAENREKHQSLVLPPRVLASRSSLASSGRSRGSASGVRVPKANRRGVSFTHIRKGSGASQRIQKACLASRTEERHSEYTEVTDDGGDTLRAITSLGGLRVQHKGVQHKEAQSAASRPPLSMERKDRGKGLLGEDLVQLSSSLGKVCDEAFNRTSVSPIPSRLSSHEDNVDRNYNSPLSSAEQNTLRSRPIALRPSSLPVSKQVTNYKPWDTRPLPPPPKRSDSIKVELAKAREEAQLRKHSGEDSPSYLDRMVSHIDQLLQPISSPVRHGGDRRTASAPVAFRSHDVKRPLPSIHESNGEYASPIRQSTLRYANKINSYGLDDRASRREKRVKETIRAIPQFSPPPARPPAPLNIRKKSFRGPQPTTRNLGSELRPPAFDLRQQYSADPIQKVKPSVQKSNEFRPTEDPFSDGNSFHVVKKKKTNWFNRSSKSEDISEMDDANVTRFDPVITDSPALINKKKSFGFGRLFKKYSSREYASSKSPSKFQVSKPPQLPVVKLTNVI
jgi:serine/threonine-protein kinase HSL1, negative regulator of Swe1 kinase